MKRPLCFTLCVVCIVALLMGGGLAIYHHFRMDEALSRYPATQVATVREYLAIREEMEEILQSLRSDEAKVAALQALHPRMQTVGAGLQNISSHRYVDLKQLLSGEDDEEPGIQAAMLACFSKQGKPSAVDRAAIDLLNQTSPQETDTTPAATAARLVRCVDSLDKALQDKALSMEERNEALQLHQDKLLAICLKLWRRDDGEEAYSREVERALAGIPAAVERLEAHWKHHQPYPWQPEDQISESTEIHNAYGRALSRVLMDCLPGLTAEGKQELARLADMLRTEEQGKFCLVDSHSTRSIEGDNYLLSMQLVPESRRDQASERVCICFIPEGDETAQEAIIDRLDIGPWLLFCTPDELFRLKEGELRLERRLRLQDLYRVPGGWRGLHRVFEMHPELRERVYTPS